MTVRPRRRRLRWLEGLLVVAFLFCLLIGLGALIIIWQVYYNADSSSQAMEPLSSLRSDRILPQLALRQLAGDPAEALASQALHAGEIETSRAILAFQGDLPNAARLPLLLQLARRYADAQQPQIAALLYGQARAVAILAPELGSLERSAALIQCSEGLLALSEEAAALDCANQAKRVAQQAPDLLPAQRSPLFDTLRRLAEPLGGASFRQEVIELARNPFLTPQGDLLTTTLTSLIEPALFDDALKTAIATRQQRARELADRIAFTDGVDIDPERQTLVQALLAEDQQRGVLLGQMQAAGLPLAQQIWLALDYREWLLLKLRVAAGGFGLSLLPEWENSRPVLLRELAARTNNLDMLFDGLAAAQATPLEQATVRYAARTWLVLQQELGLYPERSPLDLDQRLHAATVALTEVDLAPALPISYAAAAAPPGFRIQARQ